MNSILSSYDRDYAAIVRRVSGLTDPAEIAAVTHLMSVREDEPLATFTEAEIEARVPIAVENYRLVRSLEHHKA